MKRLMILGILITVTTLILFPGGKKESRPEGTVRQTQSANVQATGFPLTKDPVTLKFFGVRSSAEIEYKDMPVFKEYEKLTNVRIEWTTPQAHAYLERLNLVVASGDLPDAFVNSRLDSASIVNWGAQGILIPLNTLIRNQGANVQKVFEKYPDVKKNITAPDGNIYALPTVYEKNRTGYKMWINKGWLDKLGLKVPETLDDYYKVLKAFKENDPNGNGKADELPWTGDNTFKLAEYLRGSFGLVTRGVISPDVFTMVDVDPLTNKLRLVHTDKRNKEVLEFCAKLFKEGIIDTDVFTVKSAMAQHTAKAAEGVLGSFLALNTTVTGKHAHEFVFVPPLKGPYGDQSYIWVMTRENPGAFAITRKNKHPELTMRWVDYFYGEEGARLLFMGIEGKSYTKDANGEYKYTDEVIKNPHGLPFLQALGQYTIAVNGPGMLFEKYNRGPNATPEALKVEEELRKYTTKEVWPAFLFTAQEQDRLNVIQSEIQAYYKDMRAKFIVGRVPFTEWDNFVNTMNKLGADELLKIYQTAYERWKKN